MKSIFDRVELLVQLDQLINCWPLIVVMLDSEPLVVKNEINLIAQKLFGSVDESEMMDIIGKLLVFLKGTKAEKYVKTIIKRSKIKEYDAQAHTVNKYWPISGNKKYKESDTVDERDIISKTSVDFSKSCIMAKNQLVESINQKTHLCQKNVIYVTNRSMNKTGGYSNAPKDELCFGSVSVTIPVEVHKLGKIEKPNIFNLLSNKKDSRRFFVITDNKAINKSKFISDLTDGSMQKVLVFIHGYRVTFEEAVLRAAQLSLDLDFNGHIVLFSWASSGTFINYVSDEEQAYAAAPLFYDLISYFDGSKKTKINLLGHSMGNRVLLLGLSDRQLPNVIIEQVFFCAADIYTRVFSKKFPIICDGATRFTSYTSKNDRALVLSSLLHKAGRIGLYGSRGPYTIDKMDTIDISHINNGLMGHGYCANNRSIITDIRILLNNNIGPSERGLTMPHNKKYWEFAK